MTPLWEWGFEGTPFLLCYQYQDYNLFFKAAGEQRMGLWYFKTPQSPLFFLKYSCFYWLKIPWIAESLLLTFPEFWKSSYCQFFHYFCGEANFWKSLVHCHLTFPNVVCSQKSKHVVPAVFSKQIILLYIQFSFWDFAPITIFFLSFVINLSHPNAWFPSANTLQHLSC